MTNVVKRNARAIILDGDELILIKRTKPGREPYWVSVGGSVEEDDATVEAALHREVFEELGGKLERAQLVHLITNELGGRRRHPAHLRRASEVDGPGRTYGYGVRQAGARQVRGRSGAVHCGGCP
ncbi:hypothetical protein GCM10022244_38400 [Streptomyces gulbargensis]|uniref:Nudix hydrolase domain-containing protein n=1 Tax=Streptomyces gulbargensis TaxID=364901 RepID=A0ABP7MMX6_9ACTN